MRGPARPEGVSAVELVERCLSRIASVEPLVEAWRAVDADGARLAARTLDEEARAGRVRGSLHGVPIGVKDVIDTAGLPTRAGTRIRQDAPPAERDATVVARLRAAGAVVLGKTHTTEFAFFDPAPTRNPYRLDHTPGGSSSGSAAAVAAGMAPLALGTQTNASVCRPAAYCGVVAFKPTGGSLPADGIVPLAASFDTAGFFGRTIADVTLAYLAAAGASQKIVPGRPAPAPACERPLRIGVVADPLYDGATLQVRSLQETAVRALAGAGHTLAAVSSPVPFRQLVGTHRTIAAYEAAVHHAAAVAAAGETIGRSFREWVAEGSRISVDRYEEARRQAAAARAAVWKAFAGCDLLLAPPAPSSAPAGLHSTGDPSFVTPWTLLGGPLAVLPAALDEHGLPLALMIAGAPGADLALLAAAERLAGLFGPLPEPTL